jgi:hypothetical protein
LCICVRFGKRRLRKYPLSIFAVFYFKINKKSPLLWEMSIFTCEN